MTRKTRNSRINRKARNLIKSIRASLRKIKSKSSKKVYRGGDGQMGHTVMTESYFGRDRVGFGELENSPQRGAGRLEAMGHTNQEPTGWDKAAYECPYGSASGGGKRRVKRNSRRSRSGRKLSGGDGQMGHTVMTESYFGRDRIGFGELENSPQRGAGRLESAGHWNQPETGWENAKSVCESKLDGDVKLWGGRRRNTRRRRRTNSKGCGSAHKNSRCSRRTRRRRRTNSKGCGLPHKNSRCSRRNRRK